MLAIQGLPFKYVDSTFSLMVNLETVDTILSGIKGRRFFEVSRIQFEDA